MTPNSTNKPTSILQNGKLKAGIYKIQNLRTETYLDIEVHLREVCCRPVKDLGEGRGLVRPIGISRLLFAPDDKKWEIKCFGAGYTVQVVSGLVISDAISAAHDALKMPKHRLNLGSLISFVHQCQATLQIKSSSVFILWLGESKLSMMILNILALSTSGKKKMPTGTIELFTDTTK